MIRKADVQFVGGALLSVPLLPLLYVQGKRVKASIPDLPEATGPSGACTISGAVRPPIELLTLGESTMAGVGVATHQQGFAGTLANSLAQQWGTPINWKVYAKSGYTALQVTQQLVPTIAETQAQLVVIGLGGNDAFGLNRPWLWRKHVTQLIDALKAKCPDAWLVFTPMPPIKAFPAFTPVMKRTVGQLIELLGYELSCVVQAYDRVFCDSRMLVPDDWIGAPGIAATSTDDFFSDGVHPSPLTYQALAIEMAQFIDQQPAIKQSLGL